MKNKINTLLFLIYFITTGTMMNAQDNLTKYVDPFIGTGGHGHTYPGASMPFGMVQLSPDTDTKGWDWCSGYHYSDSSIMGFSHTHLSGTGVGDYGDILFMPFTGKLKTEAGSKSNPDSGYRSRFSHENESASPGYYSVFLEDYKIKAELTTTIRSGFHKYTFPESGESHIIIDLMHGIEDKTTDSEINLVNKNTISGFRRSTGWAKDHAVYFYAEFSRPFDNFFILEYTVTTRPIKIVLDYTTRKDEEILVKVGISHTSIDDAKNNLLSENSGWDFNKIKSQAESEWQKNLSSVIIDTEDIPKKKIFYTALYHSLLNPNIFYNADGSYMGMDKKRHIQNRSRMYTVLSLWDVFRAAIPLFTIIEPGNINDICGTLNFKGSENGLLPVWELAANETNTMIGYHSIPVLADAIIKGYTGFNKLAAYQMMKKSAEQNHNGLSYYREMGFIPSDLESESVSKTLEYAYDDWCIAMTAKHLINLGLDNYEIRKEYTDFLERSKFYINVFDPSTLLMRAKKNGRWFEPFDPYSVSGNYTEANAWQYSFFVPHDVNGLIDLMGGDEKFIYMLDRLFTTDSKLTGRFQSDITGLIGQYAHGNEPSHHMAYLYNFAGVPHKTQAMVHRILNEMYTDKPDGLSGNEDCGQMSAWYVLSALGFYPVTPADPKYIIGTPLFDKSVIKTDRGKIFTIFANNISDDNIYIQNARLNGADYKYSYLTHDDIVNGGELIFEMGPEPSDWGKDISSRPVSKTEYEIIAVPFLSSGERVFKDSVTVALSSIDNSEIYYRVYENMAPAVMDEALLYKHPITITETAHIKAMCKKNGKYSKVITASFNKLPEDRTITLFSDYSPKYTGGGALGLIDGIHGTSNFYTDAWQGYEGVDFSAVVDLGGIKNISEIYASFLQNTVSWIFFPVKIEFLVSKDGKDYQKIFEQNYKVNPDDPEQTVKSFGNIFKSLEAAYVKVNARSIGVCPEWHPGAGGKAWIFIDEITIK